MNTMAETKRWIPWPLGIFREGERYTICTKESYILLGRSILILSVISIQHVCGMMHSNMAQLKECIDDLTVFSQCQTESSSEIRIQEKERTFF